MDIAEFLTGRLDEDEAAANGVHVIDNAPWHLLEWYDGEFENGETARVDLRSRTGSITHRGAIPRPVGAHIVRHDPARVLADVAAKRAIVAEHRCAGEFAPGVGYCSECGSGEPHEYPTRWPCATLRLLAASYADHPDFDPAWRLDG